jgi:hypothetical protein
MGFAGVGTQKISPFVGTGKALALRLAFFHTPFVGRTTTIVFGDSRRADNAWDVDPVSPQIA